jgi:hypothetical protein
VPVIAKLLGTHNPLPRLGTHTLMPMRYVAHRITSAAGSRQLSAIKKAIAKATPPPGPDGERVDYTSSEGDGHS